MNNKIIVNVIGGLGNQMFQYAMYLNFVNLYGKDNVGINFDDFKTYKPHDYELEKAFNITLESTPLKENMIRIIEEPKNYYHEEYFNLPTNNDYWFWGYFQHHKYLSNTEEQLRKTFVFSKEVEQEFKDIVRKMSKKNSVAVHLRRGDFIGTKLDNGSLLFYDDAIKEMQKQIPDACFFIFSNDMNYAKERFAYLKNKVFIEANRGENSYKDLYLMTKCQNFILAPNSTFSYWGAWLSENKEKIVLMTNGVLNSPGWKRYGVDFAVKEKIATKNPPLGGGGKSLHSLCSLRRAWFQREIHSGVYAFCC